MTNESVQSKGSFTKPYRGARQWARTRRGGDVRRREAKVKDVILEWRAGGLVREENKGAYEKSPSCTYMQNSFPTEMRPRLARAHARRVRRGPRGTPGFSRRRALVAPADGARRFAWRRQENGVRRSRLGSEGERVEHKGNESKRPRCATSGMGRRCEFEIVERVGSGSVLHTEWVCLTYRTWILFRLTCGCITHVSHGHPSARYGPKYWYWNTHANHGLQIRMIRAFDDNILYDYFYVGKRFTT